MDEGRLNLANARAFMGRFARDTRANTLAIMAAALVPLAGMVGGGIDISRMYIVKTRLQHACDAGALAGRKSMGGGTWNQTVNSVANYPQVTAAQFFDSNYNSAAYGATSVTKTFTENAGKVTGTASAVLPMTLMRIFGKTTETLTVTCDAEMRLPNTDVMFVLDTTGSMASPQPGDTVTKIAALKTAVKCFYEIVARLDTDANCTTGNPSGGTGNQVQIRFGFVPYATNVNVGKLLKPEWFANSWNYETREATFKTVTSDQWIQQGNPTTTTTNNVNMTGITRSRNCTDSNVAGYNSSSDSYSNNNNTKTTTAIAYSSANWSSSTCYATRTTTVTTYNKQSVTQQVFDKWHYARLPVNVSLLKNGDGWNNSFQWPVASGGTNKTINWAGCIEERQTVKASSYDPIPSGAKDLDIDAVPTTGDAASQWGMVLNDVVYTRNGGTSNWTQNESTVTNEYGNSAYYACPVESRKLQTWPDATAFDDYVDQLTPEGNTYHDIGLIWGARLLSPTGLYKADNQYTPQGGEIERHLIFMTDGDACTNGDNYTAYGINWYARRTTDTVPSFTQNCTGGAAVTDQVNLRTEGLCTAIKNKNITLWVIAFGDLATSTETRLQNCATSGRYFKATNAAALQATFKSIADQISQLRLTK